MAKSPNMIPNFYLKWGVFRKLFPDRRSDATFAELIFPNVANKSEAFTKLKYGDYGCEEETAAEIIKAMNTSIDAHRRRQDPAALERNNFSGEDLGGSVYSFARRLIKIGGEIESAKLDGAHQFLLNALGPDMERAIAAPEARGNGEVAKLVIKCFAKDRGFPGMVPSGKGPVVFEPERHLGQFTLEGVGVDPVAIYLFEIRDPFPQLRRYLWDFEWPQTVNWLPSPFKVERVGNVLHLTRDLEPVEIEATPGRFHLNVVLVLDNKAIGNLDPRGMVAEPDALNEFETARFVTKMRRLAKQPNSPIQVFTDIYDVK